MRKRISAMGPAKKAAHLLLHMSDVARKVCLSVGKDVIGNLDGAEQILQIPRDRFAPDAIDLISQDMVKFILFKRTDQPMDTYIIEFEMLRRKAEARMVMGPGFLVEFVSVLCMRNGALPKN